jgi:hypothetical protein
LKAPQTAVGGYDANLSPVTQSATLAFVMCLSAKVQHVVIAMQLCCCDRQAVTSIPANKKPGASRVCRFKRAGPS